MLVNSISFLVFFVILFGGYFFLFQKSNKNQNVLLLISSLFFYGYADWKMLLLLVMAIGIFYFLGIGISKAKEKRARLLTIIGIAFGIAILLYFKYFNFFIESFSDLLRIIGFKVNIHTIKIIMPVGVSFFTFKLISYVVDVRKKEIEAERNLVTFATYISFFPTILSGPIDKASFFLPQMKKRRDFNYDLAVDGCKQILWGMFKKMVIADNLSLFIDRDIAASSGSTLWIVAILYSIQIYTDFSGYSDMSIGVGKILGFNITTNFKYPYFSRSIGEFWRRWHMSLLSWFRYYIYIPLGGSRCSKQRVVFNTFVVFLVSGLWHGANWNFVIWGLLHALLFLPTLLFIKSKKKIQLDTKEKTSFFDFINMLLVFLLVTVTWVVFRVENMSELILYVKKLFGLSVLSVPADVKYAILPFVFAILMFVFEWFQRDKEFPLQFNGTRWLKYSVSLFLVVLIVFFQGKAVDFIYFNF